jgi:hypothetical protein
MTSASGRAWPLPSPGSVARAISRLQRMVVPAQRKRPWYLVLALLGALALGTAGAFQGWGTFVSYHDPIDPTVIGSGIPDEADRLAVIARFEAYLQVLDMAKSRAWPLGVAALVLGTAMFVFAMRALGGSGTARAVVVQLVVAQAGANAASYWLLRDVFEAELRLREAEAAAATHETVPERDQAEVLRAAYPIALALNTLGSALIVVALTRRRARAFFDPTSEALRER